MVGGPLMALHLLPANYGVPAKYDTQVVSYVSAYRTDHFQGIRWCISLVFINVHYSTARQNRER